MRIPSVVSPRFGLLLARRMPGHELLARRADRASASSIGSVKGGRHPPTEGSIMSNGELLSPTMDEVQAGQTSSDLPGAATTTKQRSQGPLASRTPYTPTYRQQRAVRPGDEAFMASEVMGEAVPTPIDSGTEAGSSADEVVNYPGSETGEEFLEATPEQLSAESGEETAVDDLRKIDGFEAAFESGIEGGAVVALPLREAGEASEGGPADRQEEFLPFLAALAPTLISAIGPAVAKGVMGRLSPRARNVVRQIPKAAGPAIGAAAKLAGGGAKHQILSLLAKLLESAENKPGGESGEEVDEAFLSEAVAVIEVIIGSDDRVRITTTTQIPWRRICALRITFPSGATYRGSGFLIGPRAVATAGHCVYLHNQGGWAKKVEVIPGCNGSTRPFGQAASSSLRSVVGWVTNRKPEYDFGCVVLPPGSFGGNNLGSFGFAAFDAAKLLAQAAVLAGYPGDKPFAELWGMARKIKSVTAKTLIYDIDSMGGQSGAPVYITRNGQRYVVGIHNYGAAAGNSATRVTVEVFQRLLGWSKL